MNKLLKYTLFDVLRSKVTIIYSLMLFIFSYSIIYLGHDLAKATISLLNIVLIIVPLVSIIFGTMYFYNMREFRELLLAQPISRFSIFLSEYLGLSLSLALGFLTGTGLPFFIFGFSTGSFYLLLTGLLLTFVFVGLAFMASVLNNDRVKGIGMAMFIWFYLAVIFDGLVMLVLYLFNDYPLEKIMLALTSLNPIDLGRVMILLKLDISALMGYTGALYKNFFGSGFGIVFSLAFIFIWISIPALVALKVFLKRDF